MLEALLKALAVATGGAFSVGSILIVSLLLSGKDGLLKASSYVLGYTSGYFLIGVVGLYLGQHLLTSGGSEDGQGGLYFSLVFGCLLLVLAYRNWRSPVNPPQDAGPSLLDKVGSFSRLRLVGMGLFVAAINPKSMAIYLSSLSFLVGVGLAPLQQLQALIAVVVVFCSSVFVPLALYAVFAERARPWLLAGRSRLEANKRPVSIVVPAVLGVLFTVRGVLGLIG